jgi:hypothetical protein
MKRPPSLAGLAVAIRAEHEAFKRGIEHAFKAGQLLIEAKEQLGEDGHGKWLPWVKDNCGMSLRTAQAYMRLAKHEHDIRTKCADVAYLTVSGALQLIVQKSKSKSLTVEVAERVHPAARDGRPGRIRLLTRTPAGDLERESQAKYERELEREMSPRTVRAAPRTITELASYACTRPFECTPSYDPDEEEAQKLEDKRSPEELSEDLRAALIKASRIAIIITRMPKGEKGHFRNEKVLSLLAATIKNLQDLQQDLSQEKPAEAP